MSLKSEDKKEDGVGDERQVVIFRLGDEEFGVAIEEVREINRISDITKIPNTPSYIKGIINLRGSVIVVIDLATKLGLPSKEHDNNTRIIVIDVGNTITGMVVDSATEVLRLKADQIKEAPNAITKKIDADYIEGVGVIGERLLILLNLAKVLDAKEIRKAVVSTKDIKKPEELPKNPVVEEKAAEEKVAGSDSVDKEEKAIGKKSS